jgi:hypothetical protein
MLNFNETITKKIILSFLGCLLSIFAFAQEIKLEDFAKVKLSGAASLILEKGDACMITFEGSAQDSGKFIYSVENGKLSLSNKGAIKSSDKLKVKITLKDLTELEISGATEVKTKDVFLVDKLLIQSSGAGEADLMLQANEVICEVSGAGEVTLNGQTKNLNLKILGAGELNAYRLVADSVTVSVSGSGIAKVNAVRFMQANVSGAGDVIYKGEPSDRNVEITGVGSVRQAKGENESELNESLRINNFDGDTTKLKLGDRRILIYGDEKKDTSKVKSKVKSIWAGFEIGVNGYLTPGGSSDFPKKYNFLELNYKKSLSFNINFWEKNIKLYKNNLALTTGGGFEFNRYFFDNNNTLQPLNDSVAAFDSGIDFQKNCLKASYITVPLLLELNSHSNPKKSFHFAAGFVGAYNLTTKVKQVYELNNKTYKNKVKDDYSMNPFKLAATVRLGYGQFNLFATYGLTSFFKKKAVAPELKAFTVGVTLIPFN